MASGGMHMNKLDTYDPPDSDVLSVSLLVKSLVLGHLVGSVD